MYLLMDNLVLITFGTYGKSNDANFHSYVFTCEIDFLSWKLDSHRSLGHILNMYKYDMFIAHSCATNYSTPKIANTYLRTFSVFDH